MRRHRSAPSRSSRSPTAPPTGRSSATGTLSPWRPREIRSTRPNATCTTPRARRDQPFSNPRIGPALAPARRRPARERDRVVGGGVLRRARPGAHGHPRGEGHIHGGAHTPRRHARLRDRRADGSLAHTPAQHGDRRLPARHRQALHPTDAILQKGGPLDDDEFAFIKTSRASCSTITSASTAVAIPVAEN